jgi:hypothetical protein
MKNYFNQMMAEGYELLTSDKVNWPYELNDSMKIQLLEKAANYFVELEEYEKCAILQKKIDDINNPPKKKRGRPKKQISYDKKENQNRN